MIIASAQIKVLDGDIDRNLQEHYRMIELASEHKVELIVFPEMSITAYVRDRADELAFEANDSRLDELQKLAREKKMIVVAGAPIRMNGNLYIGSFVLSPDRPMAIYTKQFLHPGEDVYFSSSFDYDPQIQLNGEQISLAICADIDHPEHAEKAASGGSSFYMPSIFFSENGIAEAHRLLSRYARENSMQVLMSNFCGECWNTRSGGGSAFWNSKGQLIGSLNHTDPGLLIVEKNDSDWFVNLLD